MSLSAEAPDQVKQFGKQLFATFLGLLMALGLESWREAYRQRKTADQAIQAIRQELKNNLDELESVRTVSQGRRKALMEERRALASLVADPKSAKPRSRSVNIGFSFPDLHAAAWRSAGTTLLLHRLTFEHVQRIEQAYLFHEVFSGWVNQLSNPLLQISVDVDEEMRSMEPVKGHLDLKQVAALDRSLHWLQSLQGQMVDYTDQAIATQKAALQMLSK